MALDHQNSLFSGHVSPSLTRYLEKSEVMSPSHCNAVPAMAGLERCGGGGSVQQCFNSIKAATTTQKVRGLLEIQKSRFSGFLSIEDYQIRPTPWSSYRNPRKDSTRERRMKLLVMDGMRLHDI